MSTRTGSSIVTVGGGASGVVMAAHLLKSPNPDLRVTLIERRPHFGQGLAYSTLLSAHVLNVNASGMSAYADDPGNFARWLLEHGLASPDQGPFYAPRSLYARYLKELLDDLEARERDTGRLRLIREESLSVVPTPSGVEVALANGTSVVGHLAVLATGHDEQPGVGQGHAIRMGSEADTPLDPDARVLVLGTGLSMVDAFLSLDQRGHRGGIVAVSRRGLLPSPHRKGNPIKLDVADILPVAVALPRRQRIESRDIGRAVHMQHRMAAVRPEHAGRRRRMAELQPVPCQILAECGIGRRRDEQHEGRRHHVVDEARHGDLVGTDAAADALVALQHQHLPALARQHRRAHQRIDAAADDDVVGDPARCAHGRRRPFSPWEPGPAHGSGCRCPARSSAAR